MKEGTGMRKELVKSGKRILCGFLCAAMILTGTAFAQAEETGSTLSEAQDDPGIVFQEDFESYELGQADPDAMQDAYGTIEGGTIVETEEGKAIAVSDGKIYLEIGNVDKELQFDFQYDNPFSGYGGIYIRMYYGTGGDYYCGILPNFDPTLIIANAGGWLNNNSSLPRLILGIRAGQSWKETQCQSKSGSAEHRSRRTGRLPRRIQDSARNTEAV